RKGRPPSPPGVCYRSLAMEPEMVGQRIVQRARTLCDAAVSALYALDPESGGLALEARAGEGAEVLGRLAAAPAGASAADLAAGGRPRAWPASAAAARSPSIPRTSASGSWTASACWWEPSAPR